MSKNPPKKIRIIGSVGSGKTTLAKQLSKRMSVPFIELDNVVWKRDSSGDIRRTDLERDEYLQEQLSLPSWIIEGVHNEDWVAETFYQADLILFLDPSYSTRTYRIIKRFILQKLRLESSHYKPTVKIFFKMFKWNRYFEQHGKPNFYKKYGDSNEKILVLTNNREQRTFLQELSKRAVD